MRFPSGYPAQHDRILSRRGTSAPPWAGCPAGYRATAGLFPTQTTMTRRPRA
nr:hypothetical protein [Kibdelosporangium sp. MJ126-NF4]CTQ89878.1 hypothetical protein [Kibdelosporangium sp. MJ126-NF4]